MMKKVLTLLTAASATLPALTQDFYVTPIETGPLTVGIRDFTTLPDSSNGSSAGPARMSMMTADPLGRLFVNDQRGPIYNVSPAGVASVYLDIRTFSGVNLTNVRNEQGLQSFAFHPDFDNASSAGFGKLYTVHTSSNTAPTPDFDPGGSTNSHSVVLEWSVTNPGASTYASAGGAAPREVMRLKQPFGNHNAGQLSFNTSALPGSGDDGNLYLSIGDGGSGGDPQENGQDASNPFGALLRINPLDPDAAGPLKYSTPADNVLAADNDPNTLAEIYSFGLRNPQRFGWDDLTGDLFIADIGQNEVEEIDLAANGANFGWDTREGSFAFEGAKTTGMTDPILEYDHTNTADDLPTNITQRAVTVGEVARGSGIAALDGNLIFGDFPTGMIFTADVDAGVPAEGSGQDPIAQLALVDAGGSDVQLLDLINQARAGRGLGPTSRADLRFSMGTAGEIYILNKHDGVVRVLTPIDDEDLNGDGEIDALDLEVVLSNWDTPGTSTALPDGDLNRDNVIGIEDLDALLAGWPAGTAARSAPTNVPEPGAMGLLAFAGLLLRTRSAKR